VESYYEQLLTEGFFHADPHPGNLMWWNDRIYLLDLGMTGQLAKEVRELLLLLLLACWQEDAPFLAYVMRGLSGKDWPSDLDETALKEDLASLISRYRHASLNDLRLGPLFQELTQIALRYGIVLPASLALAGKALGQMQFTTAWLDPSLDPFAVAGSFLTRRLTRELRTWTINPSSLLYQAQKLKVRTERLMEAAERPPAQPRSELHVDSRYSNRLEQTIRNAGRRLGLAITCRVRGSCHSDLCRLGPALVMVDGWGRGDRSRPCCWPGGRHRLAARSVGGHWPARLVAAREPFAGVGPQQQP
jgi:predicted unusual protein kinase regulating ubiquinone biosynthesis (AarF/ABC1/UbiB family)